jgi:hypothetical protein
MHFVPPATAISIVSNPAVAKRNSGRPPRTMSRLPALLRKRPRFQEMVMDMQEMQIHEYAQALLNTHGDKAIVEAARRANEFEQKGDKEQSAVWRHIEGALKEMRGPRAS